MMKLKKKQKKELKTLNHFNMIDFIHLFSKIQDFNMYLNHKAIPFVEGIEHRSQHKLAYFWHKDIKTNLMFKVGYNNWIDVSGSITKYWYEENYNNLTYSDLCCAIYSLADTLSKRPNELILRSFEFGLNIHMSQNKSALEMTDLALNYKNGFFENISNKNKDPSIGKKCKLQEYYVKLYSKSNEYHLPFELLRYELKVIKMRWVQKHDIRSAEDLTNKIKLNALKTILIKSISNMTFYDNTIYINTLNKANQQLCLNWQSEIYRKNLLKNNPEKFDTEKKQLNSIVDKYGQNEIKSFLTKNITEIWEQLLQS